ncbi:MAG TPA: alkylhydroperoxidase [Clostridiales bacterium]|nr:alkylhydroperoxidase [Clostridiales bacterium]
MMEQRKFDKRIFSLRSFLGAVGEMVRCHREVREAVKAGRVDKAFAERIMLAVTRVNGCRYCTYAHSRAALREGVSQEELNRLMAGDFKAVPQDQVVALHFAQHYAETEGRTDPEARRTLVETYGEDKARDILTYIRLITVGNLYGNTFDALLSRFAGRPAPGSNPFSEVAVVLLGAAGSVLALALVPLVKLAGVLRSWCRDPRRGA